MDFSIFAMPDTWITLLTLTFLEIVLGVDNIVFISITSDRLPQDKQHIGRKLGLAGAFISRCIFLSVASWLTHMTTALFTLNLGFFVHGFSIRDIILLLGGAYLIYKGIIELRSVLGLEELRAQHSEEHASKRLIGLGQAIATIMVMDIVFSIDSVITAVGLADQLIIMILAVMIAIILMMVFIDPIANFINKHAEMKILALAFIAVIGVLLVLDSLGINSGIEVLNMHMEKLMVYFAMLFSVALALLQMRYHSNVWKWHSQMEAAKQETEEEIMAADMRPIELDEPDMTAVEVAGEDAAVAASAGVVDAAEDVLVDAAEDVLADAGVDAAEDVLADAAADVLADADPGATNS